MTESESQQIVGMLMQVYPRCRWVKAEWDTLREQLRAINNLGMDQAMAVVRQHRSEHDFPRMCRLLDAFRKCVQTKYAASSTPESDKLTTEQRELIDHNIAECRRILKAIGEEEWERQRQLAKTPDYKGKRELAPWAALSWKSLRNAVIAAEKMAAENRMLDYKVILACAWMERRFEVAA